MRAVKFCLSSLMLWTSLCSADGLMVLGDSLSAAYRIDPESGWVHLLAAEVDYPVHNASVSGETTGGALQRLPQLLQEFEPDWVLIELGGNDGLRGFPPQSIRTNLNAIVEAVAAAGAQPLLMEIMIPPNYGDRYSGAFQAIYGQLAEELQIPKLSFLISEVGLQPELMQDDGIHPTAEAQPRLAERVLNELRPLLAD